MTKLVLPIKNFQDWKKQGNSYYYPYDHDNDNHIHVLGEIFQQREEIEVESVTIKVSGSNSSLTPPLLQKQTKFKSGATTRWPEDEETTNDYMRALRAAGVIE